jgi:Kef-type K+ transport system membrane component KefB
VVILLAGRVLIGPEVLDWADRANIDLLANVGLGFLFLLAGYELDLHLFRERPGRLAMVAWLVSVGWPRPRSGSWRRSGSCGRSCRWPSG